MMTFTHFSAPAIDQNASGSKRTLRRVVSLAASLTIAAGLAACGGISPDAANPDAKNEAVYKQDLYKITNRLREWLEKQSPELAAYLKDTIENAS